MSPFLLFLLSPIYLDPVFWFFSGCDISPKCEKKENNILSQLSHFLLEKQLSILVGKKDLEKNSTHFGF